MRRPLVRSICEWAASHLLERRILDRDGEAIYLSRFYVLGRPHSERRARPVSIYLHRFHKSDDTQELHNHPWKWSLSVILAGGYREERRKRSCHAEAGWAHPNCVISRMKLPFSVNLIRGSDFHRVDLLEEDCWSLFIAGPRASSWGFWNRDTGKFTPWREFVGLPPAA